MIQTILNQPLEPHNRQFSAKEYTEVQEFKRIYRGSKNMQRFKRILYKYVNANITLNSKKYKFIFLINEKRRML